MFIKKDSGTQCTPMEQPRASVTISQRPLRLSSIRCVTIQDESQTQRDRSEHEVSEITQRLSLRKQNNYSVTFKRLSQQPTTLFKPNRPIFQQTQEQEYINYVNTTVKKQRMSSIISSRGRRVKTLNDNKSISPTRKIDLTIGEEQKSYQQVDDKVMNFKKIQSNLNKLMLSKRIKVDSQRQNFPNVPQLTNLSNQMHEIYKRTNVNSQKMDAIMSRVKIKHQLDSLITALRSQQQC